MSGEGRSLEGWTPAVGQEIALPDVVDLAFDYRGDVTVVRADGTELEGYVFNRDREATEPWLQLFDAAGGAHTLRYRDVRTIRFTGRDPAAGQSYEAWLRRRSAGPGPA